MHFPIPCRTVRYRLSPAVLTLQVTHTTLTQAPSTYSQVTPKEREKKRVVREQHSRSLAFSHTRETERGARSYFRNVNRGCATLSNCRVTEPTCCISHVPLLLFFFPLSRNVKGKGKGKRRKEGEGSDSYRASQCHHHLATII